MGRKNRAKQQVPLQEREFEVNPFAQLGELIPKEQLPKPEAPPPKPKPPTAAAPGPVLDREDQELLRAFGNSDQPDLEFRTGKVVARGPQVTVGVQRKGKGGKTVTFVRGLAELAMAERMELVRDIGRGLGSNARFLDDLLEIQGDLRERVAAWLAERGFRTRLG